MAPPLLSLEERSQLEKLLEEHASTGVRLRQAQQNAHDSLHAVLNFVHSRISDRVYAERITVRDTTYAAREQINLAISDALNPGLSAAAVLPRIRETLSVALNLLDIASAFKGLPPPTPGNTATLINAARDAIRIRDAQRVLGTPFIPDSADNFKLACAAEDQFRADAAGLVSGEAIMRQRVQKDAARDACCANHAMGGTGVCSDA